MKTCIFIVGDKSAGKSSTVRSLTGYGKSTKRIIWNLRKDNGDIITSFIVNSAITELKPQTQEHLPQNFPDSLEKQFEVNRNQYELLICTFRLNTPKKYAFEEYIKKAKSEGFDVKIAIIEKGWEEITDDINHILDICKRQNVEYLTLDLTKDYHPEAGRIRTKFFPK